MEVADRNKALRLVKNNITFENQEKPDITDVIEESLDKQLRKYTSNDIFFNEGIEGKYVPAWRRDAKEKGELRSDNETSGEWAGDTYIAGSETEEKPKGKKVKAKEGISSTNPKTGKKIYPGTKEWDADFNVKKAKPKPKYDPRESVEAVPESEENTRLLQLAGVYK